MSWIRHFHPPSLEFENGNTKTFCDFLKVQKGDWKAACHEELESLRERGVFELTDLPKGRRVVKNRWVFDIKSDG